MSASPRSTRHPRRRSGRRALMVVLVALAASLAVVPSALSGAWHPFGSPDESGFGVAPITAAPPEEPGRGMVYKGLKPAKKGSPCVGGYEVGDANTCSHGPDAPPAGLDVKRDVKPVAPAAPAPKLPGRDTGAAPDEAQIIAEAGGEAGDGVAALVPDAAPAAEVQVGPNGVVCDGDGVTGKRVQVLYVYAAGTTSRFSEYLASFRTWAAGVDKIYDASARETGGVRHVRYVTTTDCQVAVDQVEVPAGAMDTFSATISALRARGYNRTDRKYMIFGESRVYCGIGSFAGDERPGSVNRSNGGPSYGRTDAGCWNAGTAAHELGHNLGAVNNSTPNSSKAGHCVDEFDVMCYRDAPGTVLRTACADRAHDQRLDCNHDDYYHTAPSPGSYLATHWNMADSDFLIRGDGGSTPPPTPTPTPTTPAPTPSDPTPGPTPTPTATPTPTDPTPDPTPTPTATPTPTDPTGLEPLTVSDATSSSVRLSWPAAAPGTRYGVALNGRTLGWTRSTAVRIIGMRPDTEYRAQILVRGGNGTTPYTEAVTLRTTAAATPAPGGWFRLSNALTGAVADLYGSRAADRTPLVLRRTTGGANQAWQLVGAGADTFQLRSKASGRCAAPLTATAGAPLVQRACDAAAAAWRLTPTADGFALAAGDLVVGLGRARYGSDRLLVLQKPNAERYQSWTAVPA